MPYSRQDVLRTRQKLVASIHETQTLLKEHMSQCHVALGGLEQASRSLCTIAGEEEPLELSQSLSSPKVANSLKDLASVIASGNGK